jgi:hypothetical protein
VSIAPREACWHAHTAARNGRTCSAAHRMAFPSLVWGRYQSRASVSSTAQSPQPELRASHTPESPLCRDQTPLHLLTPDSPSHLSRHRRLEQRNTRAKNAGGSAPGMNRHRCSPGLQPIAFYYMTMTAWHRGSRPGRHAAAPLPGSGRKLTGRQLAPLNRESGSSARWIMRSDEPRSQAVTRPCADQESCREGSAAKATLSEGCRSLKMAGCDV